MSETEKNLPFVTIVIPCYNHEDYVKETIRSVINQDYENIELIIIDDGSRDNSVQKIKEMVSACEARFERFEFRYRSNVGLSSTLNEALRWASGEYFAPIASDDLMCHKKTSVQVGYLHKNTKCAGVFSGALVLKENGEIAASRPTKYKKYLFREIFLNRYQFFSPSQMLRMSTIKAVGGYDAGVILEDYYIYLKLTECGYSLDSLPGALVSYRRHGNNTSGNYKLIHSEREKILSMYKDNALYPDAILAFEFTRARDQLPYDKGAAIKGLWKVFLARPSLILTKPAIFSAVKVFIPKSVLLRRANGT
jgi:alpha-1,3-rhamnosyltransferase